MTSMFDKELRKEEEHNAHKLIAEVLVNDLFG